MSEIGSGYSVDNIAPLMPEGMKEGLFISGELSIDWLAPEEDDYVLTEIYLNGELVGTTTDQEFIVSGAEENQIYSYNIYHLDLSGNASEAGYRGQLYASKLDTPKH